MEYFGWLVDGIIHLNLEEYFVGGLFWWGGNPSTHCLYITFPEYIGDPILSTKYLLEPLS